VHGTLARPAAEELIGGLEEAQRVFLTTWAAMAAGGVTAPEKFDSVLDPGPTAYLDVVTFRNGSAIRVSGVDATADPATLPIAVGWNWVSVGSDGTLNAGTVTTIHIATDRIILSVVATLVVDQPILFYLGTVTREYSVHNVSALYEGATAKWMRAEVTG